MADDTQQKSVVVVSFPGGRELFWVTADSLMARWQIGDSVSFRNSYWLVVGRTNDAKSLTLTLRPLAA